ncbi:MAG: 5' nucleotidase, NT5C type [Elusimicrobiota bacterium]
MKNIGIDIDGVILDTVEVYLDYIEKVSGKRYQKPQITDYLFENCLDITEEEMSMALGMMIEDNIWGEIPFYRQALESLKRIGTEKNLYIITSRPEVAREPTLKWIEKHGIPAHKVVFTDMETKLDYIERENIKLDCFVEDRFKFALEVSGAGVKVLLMDRPWNKKYELENGIVRVRDWEHIVDLIF